MNRNAPWPADGLEFLGRCPLCSSSNRRVLHESLVDHAFGVAPGVWRMHVCADCATAYLDPRPTPETIGRAYARYHTHDQAGSSDATAGARFRRSIANAYLNHRYGTRFPSDWPAAHLIAVLFPRLRRHLDVASARHLAGPSTANRRLLDVGCGNGDFLHCASAIGWDAEGIDPDPAAAEAARAAGCRARVATLDDSALMPAGYRHLTLSHVIEHVHWPHRTLSRCYDLLEPGGRLWLETPNAASLGHRLFGRAWRGLEPPRHLILFNRESLGDLLRKTGFEKIEFRSHPAAALFMWEGSRAIASRECAAGAVRPGIRFMSSMPGALLADYWSVVRPASSEFITCTAVRPRGCGTAT